MDPTVVVLVSLTLSLMALAWTKDRALPLEALRASSRLLGGVWLELSLGFVLAGLVDVLVPASVLVRWLGDERGAFGIAAGWLVGLALPGGPYVLFPIMGNLFRKGVAAGPLITLITAKTLVSPLRMLTYEGPLMGWPITLARFLPGLFAPPLLGALGQRLFEVFTRARPAP